MDVVLKRERKKYVVFVRFVENGLAQVTVRPKEHCGVFFVKKKDGRQRMVIDSLLSNRRFRDPPGVALATTETFTRLEHRGAGLWMAEADMDNCFHRLRIDEELGRYFCLPPVTAGELGVCAAQGHAVGGLDLVWPCLAVAPMGWTWSLYLAQSINRGFVARSLSDGVGELDNSRPAVELGPACPLAVGVIGTTAESVNLALASAAGVLNAVGLVCKVEHLANKKVETLGVEFNDELGCFRPSDRRYWRLRRVLRWVLRRRAVSGRHLEIVLGHMTFFAMLNRSVLSVLSASYKFVRSCYDEPQRLWQSCPEELVALLGLMPLVVAECRTLWSDDMLAYDSCEEGRGHAHLRWELGEARRVGTIGERSRYPDLGELEDDWEEQLGFPEVPLDRVCDVDWTVSGQARWKFPLATNIGEARAGQECLDAAIGSRELRGRRCLRLGDNLGVVLAMERKTAAAYRLLVVVRRDCAYQLAYGVRVSDR